MSKQGFKIVRILEDSQHVPVSSLDDMSEGKRLIASLNEYWPGHYVLLGPGSQSVAVLGHEERPREDQVGS